MAGGHPNVYLYCANDPVNVTDPSGLSPDDDIFAEVGVQEGRWGGRRGPGLKRGQKALGQAKSVAQFTIELIPIEQYRKAISGKDCWNQSVSGGERIFIFAAASTGGVGKGGQGLFALAKKWVTRIFRGKPKNPLANIVYKGSAEQKMRTSADPCHSFPLEVDNFGSDALTSTIVGNDGKARTLIQLHGEYRGYVGTFEWIIESDGKTCNHRWFRPIQKVIP